MWQLRLLVGKGKLERGRTKCAAVFAEGWRLGMFPAVFCSSDATRRWEVLGKRSETKEREREND